MQLNKELDINIYEVVAEYKVKSNNAPFIAILLLANGYEDQTLLPETLKEELLHPMTLPACKNILDRLCRLGYFRKDEEDNDNYGYGYNNEYQLTSFGKSAAKRKEFFENRKGLLRIHIAEENQFLPKRIVNIEELDDRSKFNSNEQLSNLNGELKQIIHSQERIPLKGKGNNISGVFIMGKFENKCRFLKPERQTLILEVNPSNTKIKILNHEETRDDIQLYNAKKEILKNGFQSDYNAEKDILKIDFNPDKLALRRTISIENPLFSATEFNRISIKNMEVSPKNLKTANQWHKSLVLGKMKNHKYFMSDKEFMDFSNQVANNFSLYSPDLQNTISRQGLINELEEKNDFYLRAKLETINYLNY